MQPYSNPTRRNIEDNHNIFENGRQPQFLKMEYDLNFSVNRRPTHIFQMEDNLNFPLNGRQPQFFSSNGRRSNFL